MPALGEAVYKVHEKCGDDADDILKELNRLMKNGFLRVRFINNPSKTFQIARQLSSEMDDLYLLIRKLRDCAYIRCGVNKDLEETYKTTDSGMDYLRRLERVVNRCGSGDGFPPLYLPVPVRDDAGLASAPDQLHEHVGELMIEDPVLILSSE